MGTCSQDAARLQELLKSAGKTVFFGGAGVSTESGIPDFRSVDGVYQQEWEEPPETIVSASYYYQYPEKFFRFYKSRMLYPDALPNAAHQRLAEWEADGWLTGVITQNIDGLHQMAGSKNVMELHGSIHRNYCEKCGAFYTLDDLLKRLESHPVPLCNACGGRIKPDVVLYEEQLNHSTLNQAIQALEEADAVIVGGTSLKVYPAAGLLQYYRKNQLILINRDAAALDRRADHVFLHPIGALLEQIRLP